jgi:hypothetical protein
VCDVSQVHKCETNFIEVMYSLQFSVWNVTLEAARGECQQVTFIMKYM